MGRPTRVERADYDPAWAHRAAAEDLAGGDPATVEALLAFFDLENLAPTSARSGLVSQPQAPALAAALDGFRTTWPSGDRAGAVAGLRAYAAVVAGAPALIRDNVVDPGFVATAARGSTPPRSGAALVATLDGLEARLAGDTAAAAGPVGRGRPLVAQAGRSTPCGRDPAKGRYVWPTACSTSSWRGTTGAPVTAAS